MYGNVAPGGGVAKITGKEGETFTGVAKVYDSEPAMLDGILKREIKCGQVVIIRYEGPKGCLLYTSPSPRDLSTSRMPSSA